MRKNPPIGLCAEAKKLWTGVHREWELGTHEESILRTACFALTRLEEARAILDREGLTCMATHGLRKHPVVEVEKSSRQAFLAAMRTLGLEYTEEKKRIGRPPQHGY